MRIAINCLNLKLLEPAGSDVYLINLLQNLAQVDKENDYYLIFTNDQQWPMKLLEIDNFNFKPIHIKHSFSTTHTNLAKHLFESKYDVFFTSYHTLPLIRPKKTKFVSMIHGLEYQTNYYESSIFSTKGLFEWVTLSKSDRIIVASKYVKKSIEDKNWRGVDVHKIDVIHEGVSDMFYK